MTEVGTRVANGQWSVEEELALRATLPAANLDGDPARRRLNIGTTADGLELEVGARQAAVLVVASALLATRRELLRRRDR